MLPDFTFYTDIFHGISILAEDFPRLASNADDEIQAMERRFTVTGTETQRNKAVCAIADALYAAEVVSSQLLAVDEQGNAGATSVSIGSVSTSSKPPDVSGLGMDLTEAGQQKLFYRLLTKYMQVYRGVGQRC